MNRFRFTLFLFLILNLFKKLFLNIQNVFKVNESDLGTYLCIAANTGGTFKAQFELNFVRNNNLNIKKLTNNSLTNSNNGLKTTSIFK